MCKVLNRNFEVGAVLTVALLFFTSSAEAQLQHRWSFTSDATDSVGSADWTLEGAAAVGGGALTLDGSGTLATADATRAIQSGSNINLHTYPAVTLELWATPNSSAMTGFHTLAAFGQDNDVDGDPEGDLPIGSYLLQSHRGDDVSRTAISVSDDGSPWDEEDGANGAEINAAAGEDVAHHYVSVLTNESITLYVDGVFAATGPVGSANGGNAINNSIAGLMGVPDGTATTGGTALGEYSAYIGYLYGNDPLWAGSVDEYRIYNEAATGNYVSRSFNAGPDVVVDFDPEFDLTLIVNPSTGEARIENTSGGGSNPRSVTFDYYSITSESGSLTDGTWDSLSNQGIDDTLNSDYDEDGAVDGTDLATFESSYGADAGGDNNFDGETNGADFLNLSRQVGQSPGPQDAWQEAGGSDSNELAELHLNGATTLGVGESVTLGNIFSGTQDLSFRYAEPGSALTVEGSVVFSTGLAAASVPEPTTAVGLLTGAMLLVGCRRRS